MKRFVLQLLLCATFALPVLLFPMVFSLWASERNLEEHLTLAPNETILFFGDSITGCSITEYPNDNYRVMWRSSTPQIFGLALLKELERQGKLRHVKVCVTGINLHSIDAFSTGHLQMHNLTLFGLTWRYSDIFPPEVFYSAEYLSGKKFRLNRNPLSEIPPEHGTPVEEQPHDVQAKIYATILRESPSDVEGYNLLAQRMTAALLEIHELCQRNKIAFVVFFSPYHSWNSETSPVILSHYQTMAEMLQAHGVYFFDCRNVIPDKYFRDEHHLLPEGSDQFTSYFLPLLEPLVNALEKE